MTDAGGPVPHRGRKNPGAKSREKAESPADIPKYYYEWAETIAALPTPEQVNTLAAMPEDDARTINKILRQNSSQNSRRSSMDATEESILAEAKRRSLRSASFNIKKISLALGSTSLAICFDDWDHPIPERLLGPNVPKSTSNFLSKREIGLEANPLPKPK